MLMIRASGLYNALAMNQFIVPNGTISSNSTLKIDGNTAYQVTCKDNNNGNNKNMRYE